MIDAAIKRLGARSIAPRCPTAPLLSPAFTERHPRFTAAAGLPNKDDYTNGNGERTGNWMQTYTGRQFWPLDPRADEVDIVDIAHALANSCRYAGHCHGFYSVAEHSVLLSHIVPPEDAFAALMHDATEAYVVDVPRPLKPFLPGYKEIETRVWSAIAAAFGLAEELPESVKLADTAILLAERDQVMGTPPADWGIEGEAPEVTIRFLNPWNAKEAFLDRFEELAR